MQIKFYKRELSHQYKNQPEALQVRPPGYVSHSSWATTDSHTPHQQSEKGRVVTPPPALHQFSLDAFWLD